MFFFFLSPAAARRGLAGRDRDLATVALAAGARGQRDSAAHTTGTAAVGGNNRNRAARGLAGEKNACPLRHDSNTPSSRFKNGLWIYVGDGKDITVFPQSPDLDTSKVITR